MPPSTSCVCPVTKLLSGLPKNDTSFATSSGVDVLPERYRVQVSARARYGLYSGCVTERCESFDIVVPNFALLLALFSA